MNLHEYQAKQLFADYGIPVPNNRTVTTAGDVAGAIGELSGDREQNDQQAEAGRIEYQAGPQRMVLQQDARIWQDETEEFSSDRIVVNLRDNTLSAGGEGPDSRVRIILQPRAWQLDDAEAPEE